MTLCPSALVKVHAKDNRNRYEWPLLKTRAAAVAFGAHARFCSVAYDTDKFFGSEGNFFQAEYQQVV